MSPKELLQHGSGALLSPPAATAHAGARRAYCWPEASAIGSSCAAKSMRDEEVLVSERSGKPALRADMRAK